MIWAVIPLKPLWTAKQRLSNLLSPFQRYRLTLSMLEDMLGVLRKVQALQRIVVVTPSGPNCTLLKTLGIEILYEAEGVVGENAALEYATKCCLQAGVQGMLVLHGDMPLVRQEEIRQIIEMGSSTPSVVLVPSRDGAGTNALYRSPPDVIPTCFGAHSFVPHYTEAQKRGIPTHIYRSPTLALDLDTPEDVVQFMQRHSQTQTYRKLVEWDILQRIQEKV